MEFCISAVTTDKLYMVDNKSALIYVQGAILLTIV